MDRPEIDDDWSVIILRLLLGAAVLIAVYLVATDYCKLRRRVAFLEEVAAERK